MAETTITETIPNQINIETFKQRRQILCDSLGEGMAILYSSGEYLETGYRADGNFWYLTGIDDPGAILVLAPGFIKEQILLLKPRNLDLERFTGFRHSITDSLEKAWGFDLIKRTHVLDFLAISLMKKTSLLHLISSPQPPSKDVPKDMKYYRKLMARIPNLSIKNSSRFIEQMRMIKSEAEIKAIEKAVEVTFNGLTALLSEIKPGITEFQLDGILEQSFKNQGAQHMAFPAIVGFGEQSTVLHYEKRDKILEKGKLLLMDVGAEWDRYSSDISRTIPIDGKFNERQAELYDLVLKAQEAALAVVKPGALLNDINEAVANVIREAGYIDYFLHGVSHHLGLDTHDVSDISIPLAEGMVITVEPGIYIDDEGIGIRIEDNVLVTKDGYRILSNSIPRKRVDVESWILEAKNK
jgi:Xaa-Pro aminopeptidase